MVSTLAPEMRSLGFNTCSHIDQLVPLRRGSFYTGAGHRDSARAAFQADRGVSRGVAARAREQEVGRRGRRRGRGARTPGCQIGYVGCQIGYSLPAVIN